MGVFDYQIEQISVTYKSKYNSGIELSRACCNSEHCLHTLYTLCIQKGDNKGKLEYRAI